MRHVAIAANVKKENSVRVTGEILTWLEKHHVSVCLEEQIARSFDRPGVPLSELSRESDLMIALGGDGTLLAVARHACGRRVPLLGVNLGGLGFLAEVAVAELIPTLERIHRGDFAIEERMMLEARIETEEAETTGRYVCLNDAVINKSAFSRAVEISMRISGHYVGTFLADGLIVSTPTGSTAYSLSAGGPIVKPTIEALIATPICPHTLAVRPLIFSKDEELQIDVASGASELTLTIDGQEGRQLVLGEKLRFKRASERVLLVSSGNKSFYEVLRTKLGWGGLAKR